MKRSTGEPEFLRAKWQSRVWEEGHLGSCGDRGSRLRGWGDNQLAGLDLGMDRDAQWRFERGQSAVLRVRPCLSSASQPTPATPFLSLVPHGMCSL